MWHWSYFSASVSPFIASSLPVDISPHDSSIPLYCPLTLFNCPFMPLSRPLKRFLKRVITHLSIANIFLYFTLKLTFWPWIQSLIIKIVPEMDYSVKNVQERSTRYYTASYFCFLKILFLHFWTWNWPFYLQSTLNHQNFTINRFDSYKKEVYTYS